MSFERVQCLRFAASDRLDNMTQIGYDPRRSNFVFRRRGNVRIIAGEIFVYVLCWSYVSVCVCSLKRISC